MLLSTFKCPRLSLPINSFFFLCVSICACVSTPQFKHFHVCVHEYVYFGVQSPMHLLVCAPPTYLGLGLWLLKPFSHSVSTDLSSVLTQRVLVPSALFSELSQGVKQKHITAEDGSMLSGLAQDRENVEKMLA